MDSSFRSGFVAIIGRPNTGKSTFLNRVLGEKLSITSPKPQTTRYAIKGILNRPDLQIVFIDTPGFLKPRYEMQTRMLKIWSDAFKNVDLVLFITDLKDFPTEYDHEVLEILNKSRAHQIAVFNKLDLRPEIDREALKALLPASVDEAHFISSVTGENLDALMQSIINFVPYHDPYYEADQLSDLPTRFFATEVIREGIFHIFEQEIPYSTAVVIEKYTELPDEVVVEAQIWLERQSQKLIVVGRKGDGLRKIREYAEAQLSAFLDQPVRVHLWVKIVPNWRKKNSSLRELGFG
ncbi:MAG: GTPase Era [Candidatus Cloacimonetes bacterium]|nr:GTPase Era [Candidatus Cloacimonadota bacterium]HNZ06459.1 GTPase Era [Candidatus Cloacimonadota bacterium]HOH78422.1 GTPase Era [Candidatus Cloacimonadota bacterium]HPN40547.1 GTPase Era [Candidatus Cloacimonadota bacterium]